MDNVKISKVKLTYYDGRPESLIRGFAGLYIPNGSKL